MKSKATLSSFQMNFFNKVASVFLTKGILFFFSLGASILSARILGPAGQGMVGMALTVGMIGSQFMNLGIHSVNSYILARDKSKLGPLMGNTLALACAAALISICIYWFLRLFSIYVNLQGSMLVLACMYIPIGLYLMLQQNLLVGIGAVGVYNLLEIFNGVLYFGLLLLLLLLDTAHPTRVLFSRILAVLFSILLGFRYLVKKAERPIMPDGRLFKRCLPFSIKSYIACLCSYLVLRSDVLMVNYLLGDEQTGLYTTAVSLSDVLTLLSASVGTLLFPAAAAITSDMQRTNFMQRTLRVLAILMGILTLSAALLARFVIEPLYGAAYGPSSQVFVILMPGVFFMALQSTLSNYFAAKNMWTGNIFTPILGLLLNLGANALWIPRWGINGAAAASVVAYTVMFLIMFIRFLRDNRRIMGEDVWGEP